MKDNAINQKDKEVEVTITLKDREIELINTGHEEKIAAREDVFEAKLQQERDKGLWARNVQPWVDWIWGSDIEVEVKNGLT